MYSLRRTLAVRFCLTLLIALVLIGTWAFLGAHRTLRDQLDQALESAMALEFDVIASGSPLARHSGPADTTAFVQTVNRLVVLRDSMGALVRSNTSLGERLALDTVAFRAALGGESRWVTQAWGSGWVRALYAPVPDAARAGGVVMQVAASTEPLARANRQTLTVIAGTILLSLVATAFGATWLARSAVEPVAEIASQADAIGPRVEGRRITAHADVEELQSLIAVLNRMLERLDAAFRNQRRIIADVGHDLRTPLTSMRGQIEIALRSERDAASYRCTLQSVLEDIEHLVSIGESLILLARIEAGELAPAPEPVNLGELASDALRRSEPRANGRHFQLERDGAGEVVALADPSMVGLVLDHLLDNTIRHTPSGTTVATIVRTTGDRAELVVRDDGPGIDEQTLPHLFERLYRGDESRTRSGDTGVAGLGLTVAAAIVDAHHGTMTAANLPSGGLEVRIALPQLKAGA